MEASGQIFEIHPDGSLEIQWANGTKARSYPQEIFLVSDEVSQIVLATGLSDDIMSRRQQRFCEVTSASVNIIRH
jgi:hypothetical protein